MTLTILPAGTTRDPSRDEDIIDRLVEVVRESGLEVKWAAQVNIGAGIMEPGSSRGGGDPETIEAVVRRQLDQAERLPKLDALYLNSERGLGDRERRISVNEQAVREIARQTMMRGRLMYPSGMYVSLRFRQDGSIGYPLAWAYEAYRLPFAECVMRAYFDEPKVPTVAWPVLWARTNNMHPTLYISGQYEGDKGLVPDELLADQVKLLRLGNIDSVVVWLNIDTAHAVEGLRNVLAAWGGN